MREVLVTRGVLTSIRWLIMGKDGERNATTGPLRIERRKLSLFLALTLPICLSLSLFEPSRRPDPLARMRRATIRVLLSLWQEFNEKQIALTWSR